MGKQNFNMPYVAGMDYGKGFNVLTGDIVGVAIDVGDEKETIVPPMNAEGQWVTYDLTTVNTIENLYSKMGLSVEASVQFGGSFSASGKCEYAKETKVNSESTFLLARCIVRNAFTQVKNPKITDDALEELRENAVKFHRTYGHGFIRGMQTGGEFFAVISITSSSKKEQGKLATSLEAEYNGLFAQAKTSAALTAETKSKLASSRVQITTYQSGGTGEDQSFVTKDLEKVMGRLKEFPELVQKKPVVYSVQVATYDTLRLSKSLTFSSLDEQMDILNDYAKRHLQLLRAQNDIEFLRDNRELFRDPPDRTTLDNWKEFIDNEIARLTRQAANCVRDQTKCPPVPEKLALPEGYRRVKRQFLTGDKPVGGLNLNGYCDSVKKGEYANFEERGTWICKPSNTFIHMTSACQWQYGPKTVARKDGDAWNCYALLEAEE